MRVFRRTHPRRAIESHPRHAIESDWRRHGRISRRVLLIVATALIGGPLAYIVLPAPVAAQTGPVKTVAAIPPRAASIPVIAPPAAFIGGAIEPGDLLSNPVGIVTTGPEVAAGDLIGWPVSDHTPSTGFGYRSDPFTHRQRWHDGVDLGQPCGDAAHASLDGTVANAGWAGGYGNRVVLRHADRDGHTFATTYNHMARIDVTVGQKVSQGDVVGRIGSTGRSTACHMHFEVILDGAYVDPMRFLTGDTSKAGLSRRVGSFMPDGVPSPGTTSPTPSPSHTPSASRTPTPSPTTPTPSPTTPAPSTPAPTTPSPTTPAPTTPAPTTPAPTTPAPTPSPTTPSASTPAPSTPAQTSPSAARTTPSQAAPSSPSPHPATPSSSATTTPAAAASPQTPTSSTTNAVSTPG